MVRPNYLIFRRVCFPAPDESTRELWRKSVHAIAAIFGGASSKFGSWVVNHSADLVVQLGFHEDVRLLDATSRGALRIAAAQREIRVMGAGAAGPGRPSSPVERREWQAYAEAVWVARPRLRVVPKVLWEQLHSFDPVSVQDKVETLQKVMRGVLPARPTFPAALGAVLRLEEFGLGPEAFDAPIADFERAVQAHGLTGLRATIDNAADGTAISLERATREIPVCRQLRGIFRADPSLRTTWHRRCLFRQAARALGPSA